MNQPTDLDRSEGEQRGSDTKHMRVAVVSDAARDRNGVGAYYGDLIRHLQPYVAKVRLLCPESAASRMYIPKVTFPLPGDATQRIRIPNFPMLLRHVQRFAPHVIVVATPGPFGALGLYLSRSLKIPLCVGYHTQYEKLAEMYWNPVISRVSKHFLRRFHNHLFRASSVVVANTPAMAAIARAKGAEQVEEMGTPIAEVFLRDPVPPLTPQVDRVLFAGRLAPEKNVQAVLRAAAECPDVRFFVAGEGPLRDEVVAASQRLSNLSFLGWLSRQKFSSTLDCTDLLVLPSHVESFGSVALEAMARERLVLVSGRCGIADWPELAQGILTMGAGETLAQSIHRVRCMDVATRTALVRLARSSARQVHVRTVDAWLRILAEVAYPKKEAHVLHV